MGISLGWDPDCDDSSACYHHRVCATGNDSPGNRHPNAPVVHHTASEYSHSINNGGDGNSVDEETGVIRGRHHNQQTSHMLMISALQACIDVKLLLSRKVIGQDPSACNRHSNSGMCGAIAA